MIMAIRVVEFSNGGFKIRKIFAKGRKTAIYQLQILGITLYVFFAFLSYLIMHKK